MPEGRSFIEIDGSYGEGGGQILRTALMLSCLCTKSIHVFRVRGKRRRPGLLAQHLAVLQAITRICQAELKGASNGSHEFWVVPKKVLGGTFNFNVSQLRRSVGAISFIMQALLPALAFCGRSSRLNIKGGTHIPLSPPHEFIEWAFIPFIANLGVRMRASFNQPGFLPSGNGEVDYVIEPLSRTLKAVNLVERGTLASIKFTAMVSGFDSVMLDKMVQIGSERVGGRDVEIEVIPRHYAGPDKASFAGFGAHFTNTNAAFCTLGRQDEDPVAVVSEAAARLISFLGNRCVVEEHLADQILLYLLLAEGNSVISVPRITSHLLTNIWVMGQFFPGRIKVDGILDEQGRIYVQGVGMQPELLPDKQPTGEESGEETKPQLGGRPRRRRRRPSRRRVQPPPEKSES
jgi:RNA 3'-terminal phosphate cyclase (ATP)